MPSAILPLAIENSAAPLPTSQHFLYYCSLIDVS
jgi:hypothetical protein